MFCFAGSNEVLGYRIRLLPNEKTEITFPQRLRATRDGQVYALITSDNAFEILLFKFGSGGRRAFVLQIP